jgi:hypothetical protein
MGDRNDGGGVIDTIPQDFFWTEGLLVAVDGSKGTSHPPCGQPPAGPNQIHCKPQWQTKDAQPFTFVTSLKINVAGNVDTCNHTRIGGSSFFTIG